MKYFEVRTKDDSDQNILSAVRCPHVHVSSCVRLRGYARETRLAPPFSHTSRCTQQDAFQRQHNKRLIQPQTGLRFLLAIYF